MVIKKGVAYSIEIVIAIIILFSFVIGAIQVMEPRDYSDFRIQTSANDLTYVMEDTENMEKLVRRGHTGAIRDFVVTTTDRNLDVSGSITGLPVQEEIKIGFHVLDEQTHSETFEEMDDTHECYGELGEIDHQEEGDNILHSVEDDDSLEEEHGVELFISNTTRTNNYDGLWVDNSTKCQIQHAEPFNINEIFLWGDDEIEEPVEPYDFKEIRQDGDDYEATFFEATQPHKLTRKYHQNVNRIPTNTQIQTFNFTYTDPGLDDFDLLVFRENESLDHEYLGSHSDEVEEVMSDTSKLFLANIDDGEMGYLEDQTPFEYEQDSEIDQEADDSVDLNFTDHWASIELDQLQSTIGNGTQASDNFYFGGPVNSSYQDNNRELIGTEEDIELIPYRTSYPDKDVRRAAVAGYDEEYTDREKELVVALSYWLTMEEVTFGTDMDPGLISTSITGRIGNQTENHLENQLIAESETVMPYRVNLRWD